MGDKQSENLKVNVDVIKRNHLFYTKHLLLLVLNLGDFLFKLESNFETNLLYLKRAFISFILLCNVKLENQFTKKVRDIENSADQEFLNMSSQLIGLNKMVSLVEGVLIHDYVHQPAEEPSSDDKVFESVRTFLGKPS